MNARFGKYVTYKAFQNKTGVNQYDSCQIINSLVPRNFHIQKSVFPHLN